MKTFLKKQRTKLKHLWHQSLLTNRNFSIISNNCWGTRTYKKYGLPYYSPFQSLFIFAPDYIQLITDFSIDKLQIINFIEHKDSKYKNQLIEKKIFESGYPIGILKDGTELHFLHYKNKEYAYNKWLLRLDRINFDNLIFKFSDENLCTDTLIKKFDSLPYKNKICFTKKDFKEYKSTVYMDCYKDCGSVELEWKYDYKYINMHKFFNSRD